MIGIGVIGYGYWGPNLVRNFSQTDGAQVIAVCDQSPARRKQVTAHYPAVTAYADVKELLADPKVDAVIIATNHRSINYQELAGWSDCIVDTRNQMAGIKTKPGQVWKA